VLGESFGISFEITEGKLITLNDGMFKKKVHLTEDFTSVQRIQLSDEIFTSTILDPYDPLLSTANTQVHLSSAIQKKIFSQNLLMGIRKIELIQGVEIGQAAMRFSFNISRPMKWQIHLPFEKHSTEENSLLLSQGIELVIQTDMQIKYEDDLLIYNIPEGFSQIVFYIKSQIPYEIINKNLLLLSLGDESKRDIISMAPNEKVFPIITYVYIQDFKSKITRFSDLYQIGSILAQRRQYTEAISFFKKSLEACRNVGDQLVEAEILMGLATVESDSGDYKQAVHDFNYALKITEEYQIQSLRAGCLLSLSKSLKKLNRFQEALDYQYMILEDTRTNLDRLGEAEILVDISDSLKGLGHIEDAIQYQQAAIDLRRQMNDQIGEANNLMVFGELLIGAGRTGESMGCYEQALRIKKNLGDERGVADCIKNMGKVFHDRGKYDKAKEYLEKAKESYQNQALFNEVEEIDLMLNGMKEHPFEECEICTYKCNPSIMGIARADASDERFTNQFKAVLRESLASKNMDKLVELLTESGIHNLEVKMNNIPNDSYAFCLMIQAANIHLAQLTTEQKKQILEMVQKNIRLRKYQQL